MNLLLIGPPNAGKGTQADKLTEHFGIPHISTGNLLRENIAKATELGKQAQKYVESGGLVPDELVIDLVDSALQNYDLNKGVLFDGYPRNIAQAKNLDALLESHGSQLDKVVLIDVEPEVLIQRAIGRRVCTNCGATYHVSAQPPKVEGICDQCGEALIHRPDDQQDVVENRIQVYLEQTSPLLDYYQKTDRLLEVRGEGSKEVVFEQILDLLGKQA